MGVCRRTSVDATHPADAHRNYRGPTRTSRAGQLLTQLNPVSKEPQGRKGGDGLLPSMWRHPKSKFTTSRPLTPAPARPTIKSAILCGTILAIRQTGYENWKSRLRRAVSRVLSFSADFLAGDAHPLCPSIKERASALSQTHWTNILSLDPSSRSFDQSKSTLSPHHLPVPQPRPVWNACHAWQRNLTETCDCSYHD